jgi:hypothetical protein
MEATHFIEIYAIKPEYNTHNNLTDDYYHEPPLPIKFLDIVLRSTAECSTLQTIAIFKIKLK